MRKYTLNEVKALITQLGKVGENTLIEDEDGNLYDINKVIEKDKTNNLKNTLNVNFRWNEFEVNRAKKIAAKKGMPYQTYLKSALKQAMDKDEKNI